jgi:hypothetical protein
MSFPLSDVRIAAAHSALAQGDQMNTQKMTVVTEVKYDKNDTTSAAAAFARRRSEAARTSRTTARSAVAVRAADSYDYY